MKGPHLPMFHSAAVVQDGEWLRARRPRITGMMYAKYSATVLSEVTTGTAPDQAIATRLAEVRHERAEESAKSFRISSGNR